MVGAVIFLFIYCLPQGAVCQEFEVTIPQSIQVLSGSCKSFVVSPPDDPPTPTLTPPTVRGVEGTSVSVKCSAPAPCLSLPPALTWTPHLGDSHETLQENQDKTKVKISTLTFNASHLHHRQNISCTAVYTKQDGSTESSATTSLTADISFVPQILPSSYCTKTAEQLNCSCETVGNPSPTLQWYLNGLPVNQSDRFAIHSQPLNPTGLRSIISVNQPQLRDLSTLSCRSSNSLGSAAQQFCINSLQSAENHACLGRFMLPIIIFTALALTAAITCTSLLIAIRVQWSGCHNSMKSQRTGDTNTAVISQGLKSEEGNKVSTTSEEDIYVNTNAIRESDKAETHLGHQHVASKSSKKKNEGGSDVIYSSVIWVTNSKEKGQRPEDRNPPGSSHLEDERCRAAGRNFVSNAMEMGSLYDNIVTDKEAKKADYNEYSQVKFRDKNMMHK
uniref:cell adhesion molecule 4-like n=1 Tax=Scatophagus argus TaxID=75038 RepID=UPI001ED8141E|nr:cell adhesion molecule 4-like [Scatophagus argus]